MATVHVCWLPYDPAVHGGAFLDNPVALVAARKGWVRTTVEAEWNGRTPMRFVGWESCDSGQSSGPSGVPDGVVGLQPIASSYLAPECASASKVGCCQGAAGQPCAQGLGTDVEGKKIFLNLFFGDEFLYSSRYVERAGPNYDKAQDITYIWKPETCYQTFESPWSSYNENTDPAHRKSIDSQFAEYLSTYEDCLKTNALHEFGHIAGFAHEQYRTDDPAAEKACLAVEQRLGVQDDVGNVGGIYQGDRAFGPFDPQSIMSYCRTNSTPTLSNEDVKDITAAYASYRNGTFTGGAAVASTGDSASGGPSSGGSGSATAAGICQP